MTVMNICLRRILWLLLAGLALPASAWDGDDSAQFDEGEALLILVILNNNDVAGEMIESFLAAGGMFDFEVTDGDNAIYRLGTAVADPVFKIPQQYVNADGRLTGEYDYALINDLLHEFFHAYVDQVVTKGHDSETADILKKGVAWLEKQNIDTSNSIGPSSISSAEFFMNAADGDIEVVEAIKIDFFEEFVGQMINNMAFQHQRIAKNLSKGSIDEDEAANLWAMFIAGMEQGSYQGYSYPELPKATVKGSPPKFLIDYVVELLGLGYESECGQRARLLGLAKGQGDPEAQFLLGFKYLVGDGDCFPTDSGEAAKWFRVGAEQGNGGAQDMLGKLYMQGNGVATDYVQAYKWFRLAGASVSQDGVGLKMTPAQIDEAKRLAQEWQPKIWEALAEDLEVAP